MPNNNILEWVGYIASVLVLLSMLMSSVLKLRLINLVGSGIFSVYGFSIGAMPVGMLNLFIVFANIYYLYKMVGSSDTFNVIEIKRDNRYLINFLEYYAKDISKYFPGFKYNKSLNTYSFMVLRNMAVAGVFLAGEIEKGVLFVGLDYVIPEYRDLKPGKFIFKEKKDFFIDMGYNAFITLPQTPTHKRYLKKMGFVPLIINGIKHYSYTIS